MHACFYWFGPVISYFLFAIFSWEVTECIACFFFLVQFAVRQSLLVVESIGQKKKKANTWFACVWWISFISCCVQISSAADYKKKACAHVDVFFCLGSASTSSHPQERQHVIISAPYIVCGVELCHVSASYLGTMIYDVEQRMKMTLSQSRSLNVFFWIMKKKTKLQKKNNLT